MDGAVVERPQLRAQGVAQRVKILMISKRSNQFGSARAKASRSLFAIAYLILCFACTLSAPCFFQI